KQHTVDAQATAPPSPVVALGAAFARTATRFYVLGGFPSYVPAEMNAMNQFFFLDLAKPWKGNSPTWTKLSDGPTKAVFPAAFSADQKTMVVFNTVRANSPFAAWRYSVDSDVWTVSKAAFPYPDRRGLASVTDPNTGLVYTAGGYVSPMEGVSMDVYNVKDDSVSTIPMPDALTVFPMRKYYTSVWCQQRNSILFFGGYTLQNQPVQALNSVAEFVPSSGAWRTVPTTGTPPSLRGTHCMAANEDGTRVIVYGGKLYGPANITAGDIYILNTVTGSWIAGKPGSPRIYTTCTIAGDQFLIWGGATTNDTIPPADIHIYSITNDNWVTSYTPPASYLNPSTTSGSSSRPSSSDSGSDGKSSSSVGGIVGGVIGGLVVVLASGSHSGLVEEYTVKEEDIKSQGNATRPQKGQDEDNDNNVEVLRSQLQTQQERHDALQQQVKLLQHQASASSPPYDSLYAYQPPVVTIPPPSNPRIFEPSPTSTSRIVHDPTPVMSGSEWGSSSPSSHPVVYDPSSSSAPVNVVRSRKDPEFSSGGLLQPDDAWEVPRSRHPHTPVSQSGLPSTLNGTLPLGQFFFLDLTLAWNISSPAWTQLSPGPKQRIFPATFSKNQKSMIVFRAGEPSYIQRYIVASGTWSPSSVNLTYGYREGVGAVTDPNTNLVYIARGYTDINERTVDVYNIDQDSMSELPLPPATSYLAQRTYYGNVWCQPRKSVLYFGGYALETQPAPISPTTYGQPPSLRADHCMTINEDGTRMVVYGGSPNDRSPMSGEIFMFNTLTQTWTKGISGEPRAYATCTIAGNQLLIWGGMTANKTVASGDVLIYNMENHTWVTSYTPPAWYLNLPATTAPGSDPSSTPNTDKNDGGGGGANVGAIAGGVVGGLVVLAGVVLFLFRRRQERRRRNDSSTTGKDHPVINHTNPTDFKSNNTSAIEKLHAAGYGTPTNDKSRKEEKDEIQTIREQLQAQKEQQAALQRQVEELKSQQSQDAVYGYQPPIYYPPGTTSITPTHPEIFGPYSDQGSVVYNPTTPPPPIPPRIPVTTEFSYDNMSTTASGILPLIGHVSGMVRSPEGSIQNQQQQSVLSQGLVRSPEERSNQLIQQLPEELYQEIAGFDTGDARSNNPHAPIIYPGRPHAVVP
ncbi:Multiple epidermal growth factor-like domains protein 8, partial [Linnemannia schmuckeri]